MAGVPPDDRTPTQGPVAVVNPDASPQEEVTIVDEKNTVLGSALRADMRRDGLIHRASYILVFNSQRQLFVQERTLTKDIFPGYLDLCAGGVVCSGESYEESALRELDEELGVRGVGIEFLFDFYGEYLGQRVWGRAFFCSAEGPFVLQPEEVSSGSFHSIDAVMRIIGEKPCTPDSVHVLLRYLKDRGIRPDREKT
jgi:8-oxo-dGTP pyrophosphatase MutT (NUDIX family)